MGRSNSKDLRKEAFEKKRKYKGEKKKFEVKRKDGTPGWIKRLTKKGTSNDRKTS